MEKANNNMVLKLLIDKKSNKVLYGEACEDVVDFIFSLLALPVGTVTKLLTNEAIVRSIRDVYHSLCNLEVNILSKKNGSSVGANPIILSSTISNPNFLPSLPATKTKTLYLCPKSYLNHNFLSFNSPKLFIREVNHLRECSHYVSEVSGTNCPNCGIEMSTEAKLVGAKSIDVESVEGGNGGEDYVKGVVTYSVMDDLTVVPMSTISTIALLNKFQIKDLSYLEEKTVILRFDEGLKLLKNPLLSKTVLTDIFLKNN